MNVSGRWEISHASSVGKRDSALRRSRGEEVKARERKSRVAECEVGEFEEGWIGELSIDRIVSMR